MPDQSAGGSDLVLSTFTAALPPRIVYRVRLYDLLRYTSTLNGIVCIQWQIKFHLAHQYRVNRLIIPCAGPISICWPGITSKVRYLPITRYNYNFAVYRSIDKCTCTFTAEISLIRETFRRDATMFKTGNERPGRNIQKLIHRRWNIFCLAFTSLNFSQWEAVRRTLCLSRFRKLRGARPPVRRAGPLGSFHVAGNFTVIYDGGMNPRPRVEQEVNTRTSSRRGPVASILLIRYD